MINMSLSAVIPVRAGSSRIKNKNIRAFANSNLLEIKIKQLQKIKRIDQIVVSSDSDIMLEIAKKNGAIPQKRPAEFCDEKSKSFNEVVEYIAKNEIATEYMMWAPCVCPLIRIDTIEHGLDIFYEYVISDKCLADSVVTAKLLKEYIFDENGPVNFSIEHHVPSQKLPNWHVITNGFFIAKRSDMQKWKFVYGPNPILCEINKDEAIDIDDADDFIMAELLYKKKQEEMR